MVLVDKACKNTPNKKAAWFPGGFFDLTLGQGLKTNYVLSLWAFLTWLNVKLNFLTFCQGFET